MHKRHYTDIITWSSDIDNEYDLSLLSIKVQKIKQSNETTYTDSSGLVVGYFCLKQVAVSARVNGHGWIMIKNKPKPVNEIVQVD